MRAGTDLVTWTHVVLDGAWSDAAAAFWAVALDGTWRAAGPDPDLAASLVPRDGDPYVHRAGRGRSAPALVLEVADVAATSQRLLALGARSTGGGTDLLSPGGLRLRLTADPSSLEHGQGHRRAPAARWPDGTCSRLVQVCLDCPPDAATTEAAFWRAATGWAWRASDSPEFLGHLVPASGPVQLLVQRRASTTPHEVTAHLDVGASDREAEAVRLTALGAARLGSGDGWVVLADPDGRVFCACGQSPEAP